MNGLSDVRLTLHGPQLLTEHDTVRAVNAPAGLSRPNCLTTVGMWALPRQDIWKSGLKGWT